MKRLTLSLDEENYDYLKENARRSSMPLATTINNLLKALRTTGAKIETTITIPGVTSTPTEVNGRKIKKIEYDNQPEKTPEEIQEEARAKFQKLAKQIVGHELTDIDDLHLGPTNTYYPFAPSHEDEGKYSRWVFELPYEKQVQYLNEWKAWEDHEKE